MITYVRTMIYISCCCSLVIPLLSKDSRIKKYVVFSIGIISVYIILSPIFSLVRSLQYLDFMTINVDDPDPNLSTSMEDWILDVTDEELRRNIANLAQEKYQFAIDPVNIKITYDTSDYEAIRITRVAIYLSDLVILSDARELETYISEMLLCECEVICR